MSARSALKLFSSGCFALVMVSAAACGSGGPNASGAPSTPPTTTASPASPTVPSVTLPAPTVTVTPTSPKATTPAPAPAPSRPVTPSTPKRTTQPPAPPTTTAPFPARLAGTDWERIPTSRHVVALTFDAGANADAVSSILATLRAEGVPATFFLTGDFVNKFPAAARQIAAAGRIGNHSMDHPNFTGLTGAKITSELTSARQAILAVTGHEPKPWFRFPNGDRNAATIAAVNAAGYVPVRWTVDTLGYKGTTGGITAQIVRDRVINALQPGEIVLMHCGSNPYDHTTLDAVALSGIIQTLKASGYGFVTLDAFLS